MIKSLIFFTLLLPFISLGQISIRGKVINQTDGQPIANASVFLSNATIGSQTTRDGAFTLQNVKPGRYDLVVSIIGFETYNQTVTVDKNNVKLPDIDLVPKITALTQVTIKYHADPDREKYLNWFKDELLGTSERAKECRLINPDVLDLHYDEPSHTLTASSYDFLEIRNNALGYKIKYLITDFTFENINESQKTTRYKGPVLFEELRGTKAQERRWQKNRQEVYENTVMHFLRSVVANKTEEEGFRIQKQITFNNPDRPSDNLINEKVHYYKNSTIPGRGDSLDYWLKRSKLPKTIQKVVTLKANDLVRSTGQPNLYALKGDTDKLFVAYSKNHRYYIKNNVDYLYNPSNNENTFIKFNLPEALFYSNGVIINPYSVTYYGVWGRNRVAELLPINYEVPQATPIKDNSVMPLENIIAKLDTFAINHISEKAYLHFDKPYYAAGDTIYFKAYITLGEKHQLSDLSGVLHVELLNTKNKVDQFIKVQITDGVTWGDFALPDSLPAGNYRIVAYTRWMRNDGSYFERMIPVGSLQGKIPESGIHPKPVNEKADLQFFPEGGQLITGITSKVAFKTVGVNGLGLNVTGIITDNTGAEVSRFASTRLGMGSFYLDPSPGKTYLAKVSFADGSTNTINLPNATMSGIILSVDNDSVATATVKIEANEAYFNENKGKDYTLLIYSGGVATTVNLKLDSAVVKLDVLKRKLHTGIATVTLFSSANEPLAERLIFVQNYDQLNLEVSSDKAVYAKRGKANITLRAIDRRGDPASGHFSVSVTDESLVPVDENSENTILTDLLLTSDLKGYIEQPSYYFTNINNKTNADLDLVMLTHGYRRFEWKKLLSNDYAPIAFQPEKGLEVNGKVTNLFGKPIEKGTVTLIPAKGGQVLSAVSDDKGMFRFSNLTFNDTTHFVLSAVNAKGRNSTKLTYFADKPLSISNPNLNQGAPVADTAMGNYLAADKQQREDLVKYGFKGRMLKQVNIHQKKLDDQYRTQSLAGAGHADQVMHADEIEQIGGSLVTSLNGRLRGVGFSSLQGIPYLSNGLGNGPMLIVLDGAQLPLGTGLNELPPGNIETIEVLKYSSASIYGMAGGNGVMVITTKQGGRDPKDIASMGVLPITPVGFYKAREFYSPKYDHQNLTDRQRDLRSTVYWKPELQTGKDGRATVDYFNADGHGSYRVVIEGIDNKGNLGRMVYRYKVE